MPVCASIGEEERRGPEDLGGERKAANVTEIQSYSCFAI